MKWFQMWLTYHHLNGLYNKFSLDRGQRMAVLEEAAPIVDYFRSLGLVRFKLLTFNWRRLFLWTFVFLNPLTYVYIFLVGCAWLHEKLGDVLSDLNQWMYEKMLPTDKKYGRLEDTVDKL